MKNLSLKLTPNIRALMVPLLTITAVVLMLILLAPQGISRINMKLKEFKTVQAEENVLSIKLESLRGITPDLLDPEDITVIALPSNNPAMWVISQIRKISSERGVTVVDLSISNLSEKSDIKSADIEFEVEAGEFPATLEFLKDLTAILPVSSLQSVSVERQTGQSDLYGGSISASFYWSDFPKNLPALEEPIKELTAEEMGLIGLVSGFKRPVFIELSPGQPQERLQPFD